MKKLFALLHVPAFWLTLIILGALFVRLYKINTPLADWHSWRQADTAAVTRNFIQDGLDPLHPRYDDISNIQSGQYNPQGWRMVELPIFNIVHYVLATTFPVVDQESADQVNHFFDLNFNLNLKPPLFTFEAYGRLTSILSSLASILFLYLITKRIASIPIALATAFFFAFIPYNIFYSRVILPEPMMIATSLATIYFFYRWLETPRSNRSWLYFFLTFLMGSAALLLKPTAIFILALLPLISLNKLGFLKTLTNKYLYILAILIALPLLWWRLIWIPQFPEGIPANSWLLNGDGIRLRPAWFRWLFYERISNLILGGWGLILLVSGLFVKKLSERWFPIAFFTLMILYLVIFATGNVRHDYYQAILIPAISLLLGYGFMYLWSDNPYSKLITRPLALFCVFMILYAGWYQVRGYYQINNPAIVHAGQKADQILPQDAKVIAPYQGDTAFLYQINRSGWPLLSQPLPELIKLGATHYITTSKDITTQTLMREYQIDAETDEYVIIDLTKPKPSAG